MRVHGGGQLSPPVWSGCGRSPRAWILAALPPRHRCARPGTHRALQRRRADAARTLRLPPVRRAAQLRARAALPGRPPADDRLRLRRPGQQPRHGIYHPDVPDATLAALAREHDPPRRPSASSSTGRICCPAIPPSSTRWSARSNARAPTRCRSSHRSRTPPMRPAAAPLQFFHRCRRCSRRPDHAR